MRLFAPQLTVLVVEDSHEDALLIKSAARRASIKASLHVVQDGVDAVRYLRGEGEYGNRRAFPFPTFLLSDVKMPQMDGFQLLRWVRSDPECSQIPIIMFSASASDGDVERAYGLGANAYLLKPASVAELAELLRATCAFWSCCALIGDRRSAATR